MSGDVELSLQLTVDEEAGDPLGHPDLLTKEYIYTQSFLVPEASRLDFEALVPHYLHHMLDEVGLLFYKATWFCGLEPSPATNERQYTFHFFLFSHGHFTRLAEDDQCRLTSKRAEVERPEFLSAHLSSKFAYDPAHFHTTLLAEQTSHTRSRTFKGHHMPEDTHTGSYASVHKNPLKKFFYWWLIVPKVHHRFFDLLYQLYTFDIAHQGFWPKFLHLFTIHANLICTMTFLAQWKFYESLTPDRYVINASFIYMMVLALLYLVMGFLRRSVVWGVTTAFVLVLCWAISNLWFDYYHVDGSPVYNPTTWATNPLIWGYVSSFVESMSHLMVPQLPPYITGVNHWESPVAFVRHGKAVYVLSALFSAVIFAPLVSYISHPHLVGTALILIMFGLGYHSEFYTEYRRMVQKAELCGNPALDEVPTRFRDLVHGSPGNSGSVSRSTVERIMLWTGLQQDGWDAFPLAKHQQ